MHTNTTIENNRNSFKSILLNPYVILVSVTLIIRILLALSTKGFETDMNCFIAWSNMLDEQGVSNFYDYNNAKGFLTPYPPGYLYFLLLVKNIINYFNIQSGTALFYMVYKLPAILFDVATVVLIYDFAKQEFSINKSFVLAFVYAVNPAIFINSAVWGQVDSILTFFLVYSLLVMGEEDYSLSYTFYVFALLIKPQAFIFAPIYLYSAYYILKSNNFSKDSFKELATACIFAIAWFVALTFSFTGISGLTKIYLGNLGTYQYATVNAYNFFALIGYNWKPNVVIGANGISTIEPYVYISYLILVLITFLSFYLLNKNFKKGNIFFVAGSLLLFTFLFTVNMHERYIYPALLLFLFSYIYSNDKRLLLLYGILSFTLFVNTKEILTYYQLMAVDTIKDPSLAIKYGLPIISFINVMTSVLVIYIWYSRRKAGLDNSNSSIDSEESEESEHHDDTHKHDHSEYKHSFLDDQLYIKPEKPVKPEKTFKITKRDFIYMGIVVLIYTFVAFYKLGNIKAPVTAYHSENANEQVTMTFDSTYNINKIDFLTGARDDKNFILYFYNDDALVGEEEIAIESVFKWNNKEVDYTANKVVYESLSNDIYLQELGFEDSDSNFITIANTEYEVPNTVNTLTDEQDLLERDINYMNSTYFDEVYYARCAFEYINGIKVLEWSHPPLGKIIITASVKLFGLTPFGYRFSGALFGVLMLPLLYLFSLRMFKSSQWALFSTILLASDFMHYTQTRISTIDSYLTFFILAMFYFMYKYYKDSFYYTKLNSTFIPLFLSGIFMVFATATKWQGAYAATGLAIIFFYVMLLRFKEYIFVSNESKEENFKPTKGETGILKKFNTYSLKPILLCILCVVIMFFATPTKWKGAYTATILTIIFFYAIFKPTNIEAGILKNFKPFFFKTILWCILCFVIIPVIIYFLTYVPQMIHGVNGGTIHNLSDVIELQQTMFSYHSGLVSTHPFASDWWTWPLDIRPLYFYAKSFPDGTRAGISSFGNPAIWWTGVVAVGYAIWQLVNSNKEKSNLIFLLIAYFSQLLPWIFVGRTSYIYHYFPATPFLILMVTFMFKDLFVHIKSKKTIIYLAIVILLFILFFPALVGIPMSASYIKFLKWLPSWPIA